MLHSAPMLPFAEIQNALPFTDIVPPVAMLLVLILLAIWTISIKAFALWHAARNRQVAWFIVLLVVNSIGILELVYLLAFRKDQNVPLASGTGAA